MSINLARASIVEASCPMIGSEEAKGATCGAMRGLIEDLEDFDDLEPGRI